MNGAFPHTELLWDAILTSAVFAAILGCIASRSRFLADFTGWLRKSPVVRGLLVALLLAIGPITTRSKNGQLAPPRPPMTLAGQPSTAAPSFVVYEARTNGVAMVAPTTNAVVSQTCLLHGASETGEWIESDLPFFRWGTNDIRRLYASPGCLSFGTKRHPYLGDSLPNGSDAESLVVLRAALGIVPEANSFLIGTEEDEEYGEGAVSCVSRIPRFCSRFWHDRLPGGGRVLTWENALLDRQTDRRVTIQAELSPSGDFVYRYDFSQAAPTNAFLIGAQKGEAAVEALRVGAETNSATVFRVDDVLTTNGVSIAELIATSLLVELRWKNTADLGDLSLDPDNDGLSSHDEILLHGTDPHYADTDADGIADNIELMMGTDALNADEDGDGIPDGVSAADWMAHPYQGATSGTTNTILRVLQATAPGTSAFVSIGNLTIPLSEVRDIPLALPVDEPMSIAVVSYGDSGARVTLQGPETPPPMRSISRGRNRDRSAFEEPSAGLLLDSAGLFSGNPLYETRDAAVYILLTRLDLEQLDGYASECVHEFPGIRRFRPVLPSGFWPSLWNSANITGFGRGDDTLTLNVADNPRSIASGTISFTPPALVWGELATSASIHRCEIVEYFLPYCDLCWEQHGINHDTRDYPIHLRDHAFAVQHDSTSWPVLSVTDDSVPAIWSVYPSGDVQLYVLDPSGQTTPYLADAEASSVLLEPGSTPGVYTVSVRHALDDEACDSAEVIVFRVDRIEVISDKLSNSPNPPPFAGEREWTFNPTNSPTPDKHAVVFFCDVTMPTNDFAILPFDVSFRAVLDPVVPSNILPTVQWSQIEGPNSGMLLNADTLEAVLHNPSEGGIYRLAFEATPSGPHRSEATLVLPLAGASVDSLMMDEIARADTFVSIAVTNFTLDEINSIQFGRRWFNDNGFGDHFGRPDNASNRCVWYYGQIDDTSYLGGTATWCGLPIRVAKLSNFIVGYTTTCLGVSSWRQQLSQSIGTPNDDSAEMSWNVGCSVATGAVYSVSVTNLVRAIWNPDDPKVGRAWPNPAPLDNLIPPNLAWDMNYFFCSPFFLYVPPIPDP